MLIAVAPNQLTRRCRTSTRKYTPNRERRKLKLSIKHATTDAAWCCYRRIKQSPPLMNIHTRQLLWQHQTIDQVRRYTQTINRRRRRKRSLASAH